MQLSQLEQLLQTKLHGQNTSFQSVSIDSRTIKPGALFIAIKGEQFDGHDFLQQAKQQGAVAIIVAKPTELSLPYLRVEDTRIALGQIAALHRQQFAIPVAAVTGSNGKTTTKEMITTILNLEGNTLATQGNYNNDIGMPLTLLNLNMAHRFAVIELGANHLGEIAYLSQIAKPTISLITNVSAAHTEGFGSVENVAKEKSEIYKALPENGTAIINLDDHFAKDWLALNKNKNIVTVSLNQDADFTAHQIKLDNGYAHFQLKSKIGSCEIKLSLPGNHNVMNALLAASASRSAGATLEAIQTGLQNVAPVKGRLRTFKGINGARLIDDTYNANPASVKAAINFLSQFPGKKILVLGDMGELGEKKELYHQEIGETAKNKGIDYLYTCGKLSQYATEAFGERAYHFKNQLELINVLKPQLDENSSCLIKGSRSAKMEVIVNALQLG